MIISNEKLMVKFVMCHYDAITAMCLVKHYVTALAEEGDGVNTQLMGFADRNPEFIVWVIKELGFLLGPDGTRSYSNRLVFRLRDAKDEKWNRGTTDMWDRLASRFELVHLKKAG